MSSLNSRSGLSSVRQAYRQVSADFVALSYQSVIKYESLTAKAGATNLDISIFPSIT
jgi:hypothetical protein